LGDSRFSSIFEDPEFAIDESTDAYRLLHPTESRKAAFTEEDDEENEEESEPEGHGSDVSSSEFGKLKLLLILITLIIIFGILLTYF